MDRGQMLAAIENGLEAAEVGLEHVKDAQARECIEGLCEALRGLQWLVDAVEREVRPDDY